MYDNGITVGAGSGMSKSLSDRREVGPHNQNLFASQSASQTSCPPRVAPHVHVAPLKEEKSAFINVPTSGPQSPPTVFEEIANLLVSEVEDKKSTDGKDKDYDKGRLCFLCEEMSKAIKEDHIKNLKKGIIKTVSEILIRKYKDKYAVDRFAKGVGELLKAYRYRETEKQCGKVDYHRLKGKKRLQEAVDFSPEMENLKKLVDPIIKKIDSEIPRRHFARQGSNAVQNVSEESEKPGSQSTAEFMDSHRSANEIPANEILEKRNALKELKTKWEEKHRDGDLSQFCNYFGIEAMKAIYLDENDAKKYFELILWLSNKTTVFTPNDYETVTNMQQKLDDLVGKYLKIHKALDTLTERRSLGSDINKLYDELGKKNNKEWKEFVSGVVKKEMKKIDCDYSSCKKEFDDLLQSIEQKVKEFRQKLFYYHCQLSRHSALNPNYQNAFRERGEIMYQAYLPLRKAMQEILANGSLLQIDESTHSEIRNLVKKLNDARGTASDGAGVLRAAGRSHPMPTPVVQVDSTPPLSGAGDKQQDQCLDEVSSALKQTHSGEDAHPSGQKVADQQHTAAPSDANQNKLLQQPRKPFFSKKRVQIAVGISVVGLGVLALGAIPGVGVGFIVVAATAGLVLCGIGTWQLFKAAKKSDRPDKKTWKAGLGSLFSRRQPRQPRHIVKTDLVLRRHLQSPG